MKLKSTLLLICFLSVSFFSFAQKCSLQVKVKDSYTYADGGGYELCEGASVTLEAENILNAKYQWYKDGKPIPNATDSKLIIGEKGSYVCEAVSLVCTYKSEPFWLNIVQDFSNSSRFYFNGTEVSPKEVIEICDKGGELQLGLFFTLRNGLSTQWQKDGKDIEGASNTVVFVDKPGQYSVRVSQGDCKVSMPPIEFKVVDGTLNRKLKIFPTDNSTPLDLPDETNICENSTLQIAVNENYYNSDFTWFKDGQMIANQNKYSLDVKEKGAYQAKYRTNTGCEVATNVVKINPVKTLQFKPSFSPINFAQGCNYVFMVPDILTDAMYRATVSDKSYKWTINGQAQVNTISFLAGANIYSLISEPKAKLSVALGECLVESEEVIIKPIPRLLKLVRPDITSKTVKVCANGLVQLGVPSVSSSDKITWYKDSGLIANPRTASVAQNLNLIITEQGKYHAIVESASLNCTQYTDTVEVFIPQSFSTQIIQESISCNVRLSAKRTDGIIYTWKRNGKIIPEAISNELYPNSAGSYVLVMNQGYCSYESNMVEVSPSGISIVNNAICSGDTLKFSAIESDSYQWQGPNNFSSVLGNPQIPGISSKDNGTYWLKTIRNGCEYKDSVLVKVGSRPKVLLDRVNNYCLGKNISMIGISANADYTWEYPRGQTYYSNFLELTKTTQQDNGTYKFTATDYLSGCSTTISTEIVLSEGSCNSIVLEKPSKKLCLRKQNELTFKLEGNFDPDETFNLYWINNSGQKEFLGSTKTNTVKFNTYLSSYSYLYIESTKHNIRSNIIAIEFENLNPYIYSFNAVTCTGPAPLYIDSVYYRYDKVQWLKDGKVIPNAIKYLYNAMESGRYSIQVERNGCVFADTVSGTRDIVIGQISKPYIYSEITPNLCNGFSARILSEEEPTVDKKFQWQLNGVDIPNANSNSYIADKQGKYSLRLTDKTCEAISEGINFHLGDIEQPSVYAINGRMVNNIIEICEGQVITFGTNSYLKRTNKNGEIADGVKFQWQKNNIDIPSANSYNYICNDTGKFRLKITQGECVAFSKELEVKIGKPKILDFYVYGKEACQGEKIESYVSWSDNATNNSIKCKVYKNNEVIAELGRYNNLDLETSGSYYAALSFTVPNTAKTCTVYSDTIKVSFKDKIVNYKLSYPDTISTCLDSLLIWGNSPVGYNITNRQWKFNSGNIPNAINSTVYLTKSGVYQLETQSVSGCVYLSDPIKVEFNKLDAQIYKSEIDCYDEAQYLYANVSSLSGYGDQWERYISKPTIYEWQLDGKIIGNMSRQQTSKSGNYSVLIKNGSCALTLSKNVMVESSSFQISKSLMPDKDSLFICPNGYVNISAKAGLSYTWLKNNELFPNNQTQSIRASTQGIYKVWMESEDCATMSNAVVVEEKITLPTAFISGNKELMSGDSTRIKVDLTSLPPWTIKLTNNQEFTANTNPFEFAVKPLQTTVYELASVKNDCGVGTVSGKAEIKIIILGNEELAGAKIKLYPVPTQGICQLSVETLVPEKLGFQLYNVEGKMLIKSEESKSGRLFNEVINLETMPDGVYVLKIKVGVKVVSRKIIKGN